MRNGKKVQMKSRIEALVEEMLDGSILLSEATGVFESVFIKKAFERNQRNISKTAKRIGIHRNTLSKRLADYDN